MKGQKIRYMKAKTVIRIQNHKLKKVNSGKKLKFFFYVIYDMNNLGTSFMVGIIMGIYSPKKEKVMM